MCKNYLGVITIKWLTRMNISFGSRFNTMYKVKKPIDMWKKKKTPVSKNDYPLKCVPKQLSSRLMIDVYASNLTFIFLNPWYTHSSFLSRLVMAAFASVLIVRRIPLCTTYLLQGDCLLYVYVSQTESKWQVKSLSWSGNIKMDTIRLAVKFQTWNVAISAWSSLQCQNI